MVNNNWERSDQIGERQRGRIALPEVLETVVVEEKAPFMYHVAISSPKVS